MSSLKDQYMRQSSRSTASNHDSSQSDRTVASNLMAKELDVFFQETEKEFNSVPEGKHSARSVGIEYRVYGNNTIVDWNVKIGAEGNMNDIVISQFKNNEVGRKEFNRTKKLFGKLSFEDISQAFENGEYFDIVISVKKNTKDDVEYINTKIVKVVSGPHSPEQDSVESF